ncbi:flagellar biosynthetic protein FliR/FlhB [Clostridium sp. USBA 49]|uniref:fused FliR family export protein/FlhB family type III secretion system protein n=1 Tax=Clostridium sp. USBA 49 TaxID=1881060 RepID=UPI00099A98D3|nr:fused FliR family export protein/FlhB family type III secretion system protein [Clostridium sp. USBA 49]SKA72655.1 flagellar biosynthetic protein FliR/FlhB [Clostridium sp. USBA 49]
MINIAYFSALILIFFRMLAFFISMPIFFPKGFHNIAKIAFTLIISYMLIPGVDYSNINITSNYILISYLINEIITGLTLGFITNLCFFSIRMAGQFIDMQIGFSMINMYDPSTSSNATLIEHVLYWCSILLFFAIDGHHILIRTLLDSFNAINLGKFILSGESINVIINGFIEFFSIGLKIAIPVVLIVLITDIVLGLIGRAVPQINLMILGLPIKIIIGLTAIAFSLPMIFKFMIASFDDGFKLLKGIFQVIPLIMVFSSEDKTEEATPKKKSDARKKGQVAKSKEVNLAFTLIACTLLMTILGGYAANSLKNTLRAFLSDYILKDLNYNNIRNLILIVILRIFIVLLPLIIPIMLFGILGNFIQSGFIFTKDTIKFEFNKLNPINGFKRMFSFRTFIETIKDLIIVLVLCYTGYSFIKDNYETLINISYLRMASIAELFGKLVINIFLKVTIIMIAIAAIDYLYQRFKYNKELKMTKQEIKEEFKQQEGDPQIKSRIRQKQREMASKRMMQAVPDATVVVTNPTHIACALKYEDGKDNAPKLVAKGADNIAIKIKEIAKENDVPIIENIVLARLIYSEVELDTEIPADMYQAVAEVLALVYKMKKNK